MVALGTERGTVKGGVGTNNSAVLDRQRKAKRLNHLPVLVYLPECLLWNWVWYVSNFIMH